MSNSVIDKIQDFGFVDVDLTTKIPILSHFKAKFYFKFNSNLFLVKSYSKEKKLYSSFQVERIWAGVKGHTFSLFQLPWGFSKNPVYINFYGYQKST